MTSKITEASIRYLTSPKSLQSRKKLLTNSVDEEASRQTSTIEELQLELKYKTGLTSALEKFVVESRPQGFQLEDVNRDLRSEIEPSKQEIIAEKEKCQKQLDFLQTLNGKFEIKLNATHF